MLLTASTGAIDAVSYFALGRVFTGNMTGNVLFLGFALVGEPGIPFLNDAIALLGFVIGSMIGGRAQAWAHRLLTVIAMGVEAALGAGAIRLQVGAAALLVATAASVAGVIRLILAGGRAA